MNHDTATATGARAKYLETFDRRMDLLANLPMKASFKCRTCNATHPMGDMFISWEDGDEDRMIFTCEKCEGNGAKRDERESIRRDKREMQEMRNSIKWIDSRTQIMSKDVENRAIQNDRDKLLVSNYDIEQRRKTL